ncbi:3-methyl-2-oxobutanoate hydroxymethyltransferase [Paractinoplanes globisporus]|uniref:3-methyl-2-oxobutanoate hydroxymethyltransferase n=1 Tax=Paractinoplanes globisporus TaxID=113565 RepID=A0ABW6W8N1_9ACTN|nr:3-methyl-2-oxobutanoate hydroxymethyltransferase [Actinoplanes globisporus]
MPTLPELAARKKTGQKIVGVVAWDYQMARIADRAGADLLVVGDSVGVNLWGHANPFEVTLDEMIVVAKAVRRGAVSALVCCDFPYGPLQQGPAAAVAAAIRIVKETGADLVKLDGAADHPDGVEAVRRAGVPVFAQMGVTPQLALRYGVDYAALSRAGAQVPASLADELVTEAKRLEAAGASMIDFTNSGPVAGRLVTEAVSIPVLGGFGGGPWLDGRVRMAHAAIGYAASGIDKPSDTYAQVARVAHAALSAYADDVRAGRQIKGGIPVADGGR